MSEQAHRLHRAGDLTSTHVGHMVRINGIEGQLRAIVPCAERVDLEVLVGGSRAIFPLLWDAHVEVWRA